MEALGSILFDRIRFKVKGAVGAKWSNMVWGIMERGWTIMPLTVEPRGWTIMPHTFMALFDLSLISQPLSPPARLILHPRLILQSIAISSVTKKSLTNTPQLMR